MYDALSQEFQTEKKVKEKSNKIEVKKPIKETISIEEEKPEPPKEEEKVPEPVVEEKAPVVKEKEPPKEESGGLKV